MAMRAITRSAKKIRRLFKEKGREKAVNFLNVVSNSAKASIFSREKFNHLMSRNDTTKIIRAIKIFSW
jgi:hypothetical protein